MKPLEKSMTPGTVMSHYRIVDQVGRGDTGIVYKAEDTRLDRRRAQAAVTRLRMVLNWPQELKQIVPQSEG